MSFDRRPGEGERVSGGIYYSPEKHGLEIVAEHDFSDGCYQFDLRVVWKDKKGRLYTARDSGCSCPSPFEDYPNVESLERLTSMAALKEEYRKETANTYSHTAGWDEFKEKVASALRASR
jgi:hypothetical protein